jgi:hypothetical protein
MTKELESWNRPTGNEATYDHKLISFFVLEADPVAGSRLKLKHCAHCSHKRWNSSCADRISSPRRLPWVLLRGYVGKRRK